MIIGLSGKKRSGKSTVGELLEENFGFKQISFAGPLKEIVHSSFSLPIHSETKYVRYNDCEDEKVKNLFMKSLLKIDFKNELVDNFLKIINPINDRSGIPILDYIELYGEESLKDESTVAGREYRRLLQTTGTDVFRKFCGEDFWVNLTFKKIEGKIFKAQHEQLKFAITDVRYDNEAQEVMDRGGKIFLIESPYELYGADNHSSERGVSKDLISHTIVNDGSLIDLHNELKKIFG